MLWACLAYLQTVWKSSFYIRRVVLSVQSGQSVQPVPVPTRTRTRTRAVQPVQVRAISVLYVFTYA